MLPRQQHSSYVDASRTYNLVTIEDSQVEADCNRYMDSITGLVFHESEKLHQANLMTDAAQSGLALAVEAEDEVLGFMYAVPVGRLRYNLVCLHTSSPVAKALLVHELYRLGKILRYTPRDPVCEVHKELMQPMSYKMFKMNRIESIKMNREYNTQAQLDQLNLEEV